MKDYHKEHELLRKKMWVETTATMGQVIHAAILRHTCMPYRANEDGPAATADYVNGIMDEFDKKFPWPDLRHIGDTRKENETKGMRLGVHVEEDQLVIDLSLLLSGLGSEDVKYLLKAIEDRRENDERETKENERD